MEPGAGRALRSRPVEEVLVAAESARVDPRAATARTQTRMEQLEEATRRLQAQVDELIDSQEHVTSQAEARLVQARQEAQAANAELTTLRGEVASLRAEQLQLRKALDDLPGRISKAVAEASPPAPPHQPARRNVAPPASGSGGKAAVGYEHVVEAGQTLSEIALAYKVRADAIVKENGLKDASSIRVGQKLFIPKP
jgi:LysM repeat protein